MTCKRCGKPIHGQATTCPACGAKLSDVSLGTMHEEDVRRRTPKKKRKISKEEKGLRIALIVVAIIAVLAILLGIGYLYVKDTIDDNANIDNKFDPNEQGDLNINTELPTQDIQNIALFGLDERGETGELYDEAGKGKSFHSDAIIILTIDRRDPAMPRIKMSSLARDTLVYVEGYNSKNSMTKLTHAFDYGYRKAKAADKADGNQELTEADYKREGAKTAIKTINANFHMNVTEYMYVNFVEFMDVIDYVGGVTIDVQQREINELNKHVRAMRKECGREIDTVSAAGKQSLSGGQALAYARIRKIDSDLKRANRQRDVLKAVLDKVKNTNLTKLPDVAAKMLSICHTTLTAEEVVELGTWVLTNSPEIINYTLPDTKVNANWIWEGTHPNYGWVWIYDLGYASYLLRDFIYDTDNVKDQPLPTMPNEPKVTAGTTTTTSSWNPVVTDPIETDPTVTDPTASGFDPTDPTASGSDVTDPTMSDPFGTDPSVTDPTAPTDPTESVDPTDPTESTTSTTPTSSQQGEESTTTTTAAFVTP